MVMCSVVESEREGMHFMSMYVSFLERHLIELTLH